MTVYFQVIKVKFGKNPCPKNEKEGCKNDELETEFCIVFVPANDKGAKVFLACGDDEDEEKSAEESSSHDMANLLKLNVDDPDVKSYAQEGIDIFAQSSLGSNEPILEKIEEAFVYPPEERSKLFGIKIKIGTSTCVKGQKENCELKSDGESKECMVDVVIKNDDTQVELNCN